jgi:hypothetical protein
MRLQQAALVGRLGLLQSRLAAGAQSWQAGGVQLRLSLLSAPWPLHTHHFDVAHVLAGWCRYLQRLLLLHGRWSYLRNKEVVLYSFYKNWAYVLVYVYLQFVAGGCQLVTSCSG